jgi:hypothetical protein
MADMAISAPGAHAGFHPPAAIERPDFEIVPRKGLLLVAIAAVVLIVAIAVDKLWPLMFLHVAGGAAWTIIDLFLGLVLGPIIGRMSIPARVEFTTRLMPKMLLIMPTVVTLTLAAGWQLGVKTGNVLPLAPAVILLVLSALLLVANMAALARIGDFAWTRFFQVARWSLLAYTVIAGLILYSFLQNHLPGGALIVLTLSLVVFAVHVPMLVGFTVARYYEPDPATG